ncbi:hypothetical protein DHC50_13905 [Arenibacter sp. A80]|nr:hypothetical protein [Arenibacter sp. A80]RFT55768.1 hypothetical protein D0S24_13900 [Arenibacter sp. P308M17]
MGFYYLVLGIQSWQWQFTVGKKLNFTANRLPPTYYPVLVLEFHSGTNHLPLLAGIQFHCI